MYRGGRGRAYFERVEPGGFGEAGEAGFEEWVGVGVVGHCESRKKGKMKGGVADVVAVFVE